MAAQRIFIRISLFLFILFCGLSASAQKKFTITVCIDGETWLHVKNGQLFWDHNTHWAPGTHQLCKIKTTINNKVWENREEPFPLNFNTNNLTVETKVIKQNMVSKLVQAPSAANDWETIWVFSDPASGPHEYSVSFIFNPEKPANAGNPVVNSQQDANAKLTAKELKTLIDSLCTAINRNYIFPDKAKLMTDAIKSQYKKGVYAKAKDKRELSNMIHNDVRTAHYDGHFRFYYDPQLAEDISKQMTDSERVQQYKVDLKEMQKQNFAFIKAEILPGNIGFLRWDGFTGMVDEAAPTFKAAFKLVENADALIIDMRNNGGGSPEMVLHLQNYFFDKKIGMNHIFSRVDTIMRYSDPSKTEFKLNMPVYILTARRTFSGAEDFTYGLKFGNRATVVGDTTGGGAHPTDFISVGMGFMVNLPFARSYHEVTKTDWEGTGVRPDVPVNSDHALFKAQTVIYKDLLSKANEPFVKNDLKWQMDVAQNKLGLAKQISSDSITITKDYLKSLVGEYKPKIQNGPPTTMGIVFKGNNIYRRVNNTNVPDARLSPISATRFVYDDDSGRFIDFILDKDGKVTEVAVTRWDGTSNFTKIK